jgi:hypothetical protein
MLRRVSPIMQYFAAAVVCFFAGVRMEPMMDGSAREHAAEARALPGPAALRLGDRELLNSGIMHNEAIQAGGAQAILTEPPTPAQVPALAPPAESAAQLDVPKPSTVNGNDPETGNDYVELKDLPEVQGMGGESEKARDVDMIGDEGVPVPDANSDRAPAK